MNTSNSLEKHPIWDDFITILPDHYIDKIVRDHLDKCNYRVVGYWDGVSFYEEVSFNKPLDVFLKSRSLILFVTDSRKDYTIKLTFLLTVNPREENRTDQDIEVGELTLILDSNLTVIDENWIINIDSPFVVKKRKL